MNATSSWSVLLPPTIESAVASGDQAMVARAQGVGPKLAQRIVNELRDKVGSIALGSGVAGPTPQQCDTMRLRCSSVV